MLLNTWKHHAAALRREIRKTVQAGASALDGLADELIVIGTELMDLYTGYFTPSEIGSLVLAQLRFAGHRTRQTPPLWRLTVHGPPTLGTDAAAGLDVAPHWLVASGWWLAKSGLGFIHIVRRPLGRPRRRGVPG